MFNLLMSRSAKARPTASRPVHPPLWGRGMTALRRVAPLSLLFLLLGVLALFALTASDNVARAQTAGPTPQTYEVPNDWALKPSGLNVDDEFRLLFLSAASRNGTSGNIKDYNAFVQGGSVLDRDTVAPNIRALRGEFRALVSTQNVDARDNTVTTGTGVPIYWLDGAKAADDYGDFYDGSWDSTEARNEAGDTFTTNPEAWTGSGNDGTEYLLGTISRALGAGLNVRYGDVDLAPLSRGDAVNTGNRSIYAISPVFKVVDQGAPTVQTVPGDWPLIPGATSDAGNQFRLLFVTSGERDASGASIAHYNLFAQAHAGGGHEAIRPYRNQFRALGSTETVDANDNTALTGTGVPIYALSVDGSGNFNGAKVADDYGDFCDGDWDETANKDESGADRSASIVWTGSDDDCEGVTDAHFGHSFSVRIGLANDANDALNDGRNFGPTSDYPLYALSPVFTVSSAPSVPRNVAVSEITHVSARMSWGEPSYTGAHPIFQYQIEVRRCLSDINAPCASWTGWGDAGSFGSAATSGVITAYDDDKGTENTADDERLDLAARTRYQARVQAHSRENPTADTVYGEWSDPTVFITAPDYDADDDGLIEVANLAQLNAIRWDLDGDGAVTDDTGTADFDEAEAYDDAFPNPVAGMGCPDTGCTGYELTANLDFDTGVKGDRSDDDYANVDDMGTTDTSDDVIRGWDPIGDDPNPFDTTFEGNGHAISNLFIDRTEGLIGLFGRIDGVAHNLGVADANVTGRGGTGVLVGDNRGRVVASWATGSVNGNNNVGGLVGHNDRVGVVSASYAAVSVSNDQNNTGGLVGRNRGAVSASYATGAVTSSNLDVGGLVGSNLGGSITASYATGTVTGGVNMGGLVGSNADEDTFTGRVINSYWDTEASGRAVGIGNDDVDNSDAIDGAETATDGATGKTGAELRAPTGYTGIYSAWNLDLDNADGDNSHATGQDDPWDFGADYNYPALSVDFDNDGTATWQEFGAQRRPGPPTIARVWREHGISDDPDTTEIESPVEILWIELTPPTDLGSGGIGSYEFRVGQVSATDPTAITWTPTNTDEWASASSPSRFGVGYMALHSGSYQVMARAVNDAPYPGESVQYDTPSNPPAAPDLTLTPGDRSIYLTWGNIVNTGEPLYTHFEVEYRLSWLGGYRTSSRDGLGRYSFHEIPRTDSEGQLLSGEERLVNGEPYEVRVRAVVAGTPNNINGEWTEAIVTPNVPTPPAVPRPCPTDNLPRNLTLTPGAGRIVATWMSADMDNPNLNNYILEYREQGVTGWQEWPRVINLDNLGRSNGDLTWTVAVTGLTNGITYEARVAAVQITHDVNIRSVCDYTEPVAATPDEVAVSITRPSNGAEYYETDTIRFDFSLAEYLDADLDVTVNVQGGGDFLIDDGDRTVTIPAGWIRGLLIFFPDNDDRNDEDATLTVTVKDGDGYSPGSPASVSVALLDDDPDDLPVFDPSARRVPGVPYTDHGTPPWLTAGDRQIAVEWGVPSDLGNPTLSGYQVQYREAHRYGPGDEGWSSLSVGRTTPTTATITDLTNGQEYEVRVASRNSVGTSEYTFPAARATPVGPPAAPRNLALSAGDGEIGAQWDPPSDDGGRPISGYSVQYRKGTTGEWTTVSTETETTTTSYTIESLENDSEYQVQVAATNSEGTGPFTSPSLATPTTKDRVPGIPRNLVLTPGNGSIGVSWDVPTDQGNPALSDYQVQYRKADVADWTTIQTGDTTTSYTIGDLVNNVEYKVRVAAGNSNEQDGQRFGNPTSEQSATPSTKPSAPLNLMHDPPMSFVDVDGTTKKEIVVSWSPPASDGGSDITSYRVEYRSGTSGAWLSKRCPVSDDPPALTEACSTHRGDMVRVAGVMGPLSGTYQVRVAAVNREGTGAYATVSVGVR